MNSQSLISFFVPTAMDIADGTLLFFVACVRPVESCNSAYCAVESILIPVTIHTASADDQYAITAIVHAARINPRDLDWQRFLLAQWGQDIIGVGQVKPHPDGSRELASLAVVPEWQGNGVGGVLVRALLSRETGPLHLMCDDSREHYYERFGFKRLARHTMPPYFRRFMLVAPVLRLLSLNRLQLIVMGRER